MRIVSLVPSITLLLIDLGLEDSIVGRTKFCTLPIENVRNIPTIGGTKNIDIDKIKALEADFIIANKEENVKEQIEALKIYCKVILFDVRNLDENYKMIAKIAKLTNTNEKAQDIIKQTQANFEKLQTHIAPLKALQLNAVYMIWKKPYMTVGKDTFIHAMLEHLGVKNMFSHQTRYPIIQQFNTSYFEKCNLVFLSSEPYPFEEKHIREFQTMLPNTKIILVDGTYFSWYGSKMIDAPKYYQQLAEKISAVS